MKQTPLFNTVSTYLKKYCEEYRKSFLAHMEDSAFTQLIDKNDLPIYANLLDVTCWIANDGIIITQLTNGSHEDWHLSGGPAIMVDTEPSLSSFPKKNSGHIGIYRVVSQDSIPKSIWHGALPKEIKTKKLKTNENKSLTFNLVRQSKNDVLKALTFGAFGTSGSIVKVALWDEKDDFWDNFKVRELGFFPADCNQKRFFKHLEVCHNLDQAAWDMRSIWIRVKHDTYIEIMENTLKVKDKLNGGFITQSGFLKTPNLESNFRKKLGLSDKEDPYKKFEDMINNFKNLLEDKNYDNLEPEVHQFLLENPCFLSIYGEITSKPRFYYPQVEQVPEKKYVEPDFIIKYPSGSYEIIEIERPNKPLLTKKGPPSYQTTQAVHQLAEFSTYIETHPHLLEEKFPNMIRSNCTFTLVMGNNDSQSSPQGNSFKTRKNHLKNTYSADAIYTYTDLLLNAQKMLDNIKSV